MVRKTNKVAVGYSRVSTTLQAQEGVSLDAQQQKIRDYCRLHDLELIGLFSDEISGKRADNRPGLQEALKMVRQRKAVLVVWALNRFARSTMDCLTMVGQLNEWEADLASITEHLDTTTSMGKFVFTLSAALAQLERDQISERTVMALAYKKANGERTGGVPYGYALSPDGVHLLPIQEQLQAIVKMCFLRCEGRTYQGIADQLNAEGVPAKDGGKWSASVVYKVLLRNPVKVAEPEVAHA